MSEEVPPPVPPALIALVVVAATAIAAIVIAAWLLQTVARRAIDKSTPEGVPIVIIALSSLIAPLSMFLPWPSAPRETSASEGEQAPAQSEGGEA